MGASRSAYSLNNQLKVNPDFADPPKGKIIKQNDKPTVTFDDVEKVIKKVRTEWGIASICDIVLNHTANESTWILEHPEATYSCYTMPHLRPAFLLDAIFGKVTADTAAGLLENVGVPIIIENDDHIQALRHQLRTVYLPKTNIAEFYQCDIEKYFQNFSNDVRNGKQPSTKSPDLLADIELIQDPEYGRLTTTIDYSLALAKYNVFR